MINTLNCEYLLKHYKYNNLNLFFPLSYELSDGFRRRLDEIIYENIFHDAFNYYPPVLTYFKKHNEHIMARKLDEKRYKYEKRRYHCNLGNKGGSKFDIEWKNYSKKEMDILVNAVDLEKILWFTI